jgi:hypothetical protein
MNLNSSYLHIRNKSKDENITDINVDRDFFQCGIKPCRHRD